MDTKDILSTNEVATLLNVAETTIKRWSDEQTLPCIKTPGGHRKFLVRQVIEFAEKHKYPLHGLLPPPLSLKNGDRLQFAVHAQNFSVLAELFLDELLQADRLNIRDFFSYLYKHHIPYASIIDEILQPAMENVGILWKEGTLEVHREHLISQAAGSALQLFSAELHRKPSNGLTMLCSCGEKEFHCLGLQALAIGFECEGWTVRMMGQDLPYDSLRDHIRTEHPNALCLSATTSTTLAKLKKELPGIVRAVHGAGGVVLLGGRAVSGHTSRDLPCDHIAGSLNDALSFIASSDRVHTQRKKNHIEHQSKRKKG